MYAFNIEMAIALIDKFTDAKLKEALRNWIELDKDVASQQQTLQLLSASDEATLKKIFHDRLEFGTAGLRAKMGPGFSRMNDVTIQQTTQGLCEFLKKTYGEEACRKRGIVIGNDGRHNSRNFVEIATSVLLSKNVKVFLFSKTVPTPIVPYTLLKKKCLAGIVVTASHNPKDDNGYKVYAENGAQIIPPIDQKIVQCIHDNLDFWPDVEQYFDREKRGLSTQGESHELLIDPYEEIINSYVENISKELSLTTKDTENSTLKVVHTAMHGVGTPVLVKLMNAFGFKSDYLLKVEIQAEPDPDFTTVSFPNPEEKGALDLAMKFADDNNVTLIIANDPDADRFACAEKIDGKWHQYTGDEVGIILGFYAMETHLSKGIEKKNMLFVSSAVSSKMLKTMAEHEGCQFRETMTGFKWMENEAMMVEKSNKNVHVVLVYEEALGYALSRHVRDKDGISAACFFVQLACQLYKKNNNNNDKIIYNYLDEIRKKYGYFTTYNTYFISSDKDQTKKMFGAFRDNKKYTWSIPNPNTNGGVYVEEYKIVNICDVYGGFDSSQEDKKCRFPSSSNEMIQLYFDNMISLTVRTSGTEPKVKIYSEIVGKKQNDKKDVLINCVEAVILWFRKAGGLA